MNLADMRTDYRRGRLRREDLKLDRPSPEKIVRWGPRQANKLALVHL